MKMRLAFSNSTARCIGEKYFQRINFSEQTRTDTTEINLYKKLWRIADLFSWQDSVNDMLLTAIHIIAHAKHKQKQGDKTKERLQCKFIRSFLHSRGMCLRWTEKLMNSKPPLYTYSNVKSNAQRQHHSSNPQKTTTAMGPSKDPRPQGTQAKHALKLTTNPICLSNIFQQW